jgi:hypothetical protein
VLAVRSTGERFAFLLVAVSVLGVLGLSQAQARAHTAGPAQQEAVLGVSTGDHAELVDVQPDWTPVLTATTDNTPIAVLPSLLPARPVRATRVAPTHLQLCVLLL